MRAERVGDENLRAVRGMFEEFARGASELTFRTFDDQITWDARGLPVPDLAGIVYSPEGVREFWRTWFETWESIEILDEATHHSNGNQVVSLWRQRMRGKSSGAAVEMEAGFIWTFENGRIVRVAIFASYEEALRAAGFEA